MNGSKALIGVVVGGCLLLTAVSSARADWLITREGARIETRGPWEVRGRLLVFTLPDGKLASMRLTEVDLEASELATAEGNVEAREPETKEPPQQKKAVVNLTDSDFTRIRPAPAAAEQEGEAATPEDAEPSAASDTATGLTVSSWQRQDDPVDNHVVITGTLRNAGRSAATGPRLTVKLYDEEGEVIAERPAVLSVQAFPPRGQGTFRVDFPDVFGLSSVKFEVESRNFETRPEAEAGAEVEEPPAASAVEPPG